jgi:hypothetical protein
MARVHQAEAVGNGHETIGRREAFYGPASLDKDPIFCGDDRNKEGIQLFGGVVNIAYNEAVLEEVVKPGSVTDSLEGRVEAKTAALIREGMHPGVHSDENAEEGNRLKEHSEGSVGCAYAELRAAISEGIGDLGSELIDQAARLRPELFEQPDDYEFGLAVTAAHGRLAKRKDFQAPGRKVVLAAASKGAKTTVYEGGHIAGNAISNEEPATRFDGSGAMNEGLPAYNHDAWAAEEIARRLNDPSDSKQRQIANLIDMLGTVRALGVGDTLVRR